jgi:ABC-type branched-subunit amino acid transport system permease subunit
MKNPFRFFVELIQQPVLVPAWVFILMIVNLVSVVFWDETLAKLIFVTFMLSAILMMGLYLRFGFEKILGLGHILWIPLLVYVLVRLPSIDGSFKSYLITLSITIGISLVFDTIDVWRYFSTRRNA